MKILFTRKNLIILAFSLITVLCLALTCGCNKDEETEFFTLTYVVDNGGYIDGELRQTVAYGENATPVEAIPNEGYVFVKWSDDVTTAARTDSNITSDITVTAIFEKHTYSVVYATDDGNGTIEGEASQTVSHGENATPIEAIPNEGYVFVKWSDEVTTSARTDLNVTSDITAIAIFEKLTYSVVYITDGNGTIEGEASQTVAYGENAMQVEAVPNDRYEFVKWSDNVTTAERTDLRISSDLTLTAIFKIRTFSVVYTTDGNGTIEGEASQLVSYGESATPVEAVPNEGYRFLFWIEEYGCNESAERTDYNIISDIRVVAVFEKIKFTVEYKTNGYGSIYYDIGYKPQVNYGEETAVTAKPLMGYTFLYWSDGVQTASRRDYIYDNLNVVAYFGYIIEYAVDGEVGGSIAGECLQKLMPNSEAAGITAVAEQGYVFAGWSDMQISAERKDIAERNWQYVAYFELIEKTFKYDYGEIYGAPLITSVTVNRFKLDEVQYIIPELEGYKFCGWYLDSGYNTKIINEYGKLMLGYYTFVVETDTIYAKWQEADDEVITYKVLNVIVDEAHASLYSTITEDYVAVDYKMSPIERKLFSLYANKMQGYINEWFEGKLIFEFDNYFTTQPISTDSFSGGLTSTRKISYHVMANDIPEVQYLIPDYHCMLTIAGMNDYNDLLHFEAGTAWAKYGMLHIEELLGALIINHIPLNERYEEFKNDTNIKRWDSFAEHYFHEFTHTIESRYTSDAIYEFHKIQGFYINNQLEGTKLYLLGKAVAGDKLVGVPQSYWEDPTKWNYGYGQLS